MKTRATATSTDTMRAITQARYGNSEVLRLARVPRPVGRDDQVLIHVHAAGLDRGTEHLMTGKPYAVRLASGIRRPRNPVPGRDVAGAAFGTLSIARALASTPPCDALTSTRSPLLAPARSLPDDSHRPASPANGGPTTEEDRL